MTDHDTRLYALAVALLVFFVAWAAIAARPWATASDPGCVAADPRVAALVAEQQRVRAESRWRVDRVSPERRQQRRSAACCRSAAAPPVRVVTLPPLTITRTS